MGEQGVEHSLDLGISKGQIAEAGNKVGKHANERAVQSHDCARLLGMSPCTRRGAPDLPHKICIR